MSTCCTVPIIQQEQYPTKMPCLRGFSHRPKGRPTSTVRKHQTASLQHIWWSVQLSLLCSISEHFYLICHYNSKYRYTKSSLLWYEAGNLAPKHFTAPYFGGFSQTLHTALNHAAIHVSSTFIPIKLIWILKWVQGTQSQLLVFDRCHCHTHPIT